MAESFEPSDVVASRVGFWIAGLALAALAVAGIVALLLAWLEATTLRPPASLVELSPLPPPEPRLQASPKDDLARLRKAESQRLDGLGWVDQSQGRVHIPIRRAEEMMVRRGWPK